MEQTVGYLGSDQVNSKWVMQNVDKKTGLNAGGESLLKWAIQMTTPKTSGLKAPSKIGKPSGLVQPKTGIPGPGATSAIAKSARAAGLSAGIAEKYAANALPTRASPRPGSDESQTPVDDFIIGDRVFINGTKPGYIAFLGETQFAPGEWAGIVLDDPVGKNDGQVAGVRYFQCAAKHGVFSRITKLTRTQGQMPPASLPPPKDTSILESKTAEVTNGAVSNVTPTAQPSSHLPQMRSTTPRLGLSASKTKSASQQSLSKISPASSFSNLKDSAMLTSTPLSYGSAKSLGNLRTGDRVLVSGTKTGTLRYLGVADFAKGDWAGVELDEPQGKNDGAVAGKRYFDCRPMHGLFAPLKKVAKLTSGSIPTPSPQTRTLANTSLKLSRDRSGSQDSISSLSSTASSVSRSRAKAGQSRPGTLNITATTAALQKALKEKEEHIEQLLRERDLERAEVARVAMHIDEAEGKLLNHQSEHGKYREDAEESIKRFKTMIIELEKDKKDALLKLEDERRKVEDLQFQIEEESINKDDIESKTEEDITRLSEQLKKEKEKSIKFEQDLVALKALCDDLQQKLKNSEEVQLQYLDQIEDLTHQLKMAEDKLKTFDSSRVEEGAKTSQVSLELAEKSAKVAELEQLLADRNKDVKTLERNVNELEENLMFANEKNLKIQTTVDELSNRIMENDASNQNMNSEFQGVKSRLSDLQRQLDSSNEKNDQLNDDKQKLEQQIAELMQNSGDHSNQLSMLNEQVKEKARKIEDLQANLSNSTQRIGALNEQIEHINEEYNREKGALILKHDESTKTLQGQLEDVQNELKKNNEKKDKFSEESEKEKLELSSRKDNEISELKKQLQMSTEQLEKQEVQTQAHKQFLEKLTLEKDAIKYEKEKTEKLMKRYESEKESLNQEVIQTKVHMTKQQTDWDSMSKEKERLTEELDNMKYENEKLSKVKEEFQKQKSELSTEKNDIIKDKRAVEAELTESKSLVDAKNAEVKELQEQIEKLKADMVTQGETLMQKSQEASEVGDLQKQIHDLKGTMDILQTSLKDTQAERDKMKIEMQNMNLITEDRKRLETQVQQLQKQMEDSKLSHSQEMDNVQTDRTALQGRIEATLKTLQQREQDILLHKEQITNLMNQNATLMNVQSSVEKLESEKKDLNDYTKSLEKQLKESQQNANVLSNNNVGDPAVAKVIEEKNEALQQIEFLNSVIADTQKKNEELKIRLEAMESGVQNSNSVSAMDVGSPQRKPAPPPRLFCDICDVFDLHDTEDCPQQAMSDSPPPSYHHGDRKQMRPYCDICEGVLDECTCYGEDIAVSRQEESDTEGEHNLCSVEYAGDGVQIVYTKKKKCNRHKQFLNASRDMNQFQPTGVMSENLSETTCGITITVTDSDSENICSEEDETSDGVRSGARQNVCIVKESVVDDVLAEDENDHSMTSLSNNTNYTEDAECGPGVGDDVSNDCFRQEEHTFAKRCVQQEVAVPRELEEPASDFISEQVGTELQKCSQMERERENYDNMNTTSEQNHIAEQEKFDKFVESSNVFIDENAKSEYTGLLREEDVSFSRLQKDCTLSHIHKDENSVKEFTTDTSAIGLPLSNDSSDECRNAELSDQDQGDGIDGNDNIVEWTKNDMVVMQDDDSGHLLENFDEETESPCFSENTTSLQQQDIKMANEPLYSVMSGHDNQTYFDNECLDYQEFQPNYEKYDAGLGEEIVQNGVGKFGDKLEHSIEVINKFDKELTSDTDGSKNKFECGSKIQNEASSDNACQEQDIEVTNQDPDEIVSREMNEPAIDLSSIQDDSVMQQCGQIEKVRESFENMSPTSNLDHLSEPENFFNNFAEPSSNSNAERTGSEDKGIMENEGVTFTELQKDCSLSHTEESVNSDEGFTTGSPVICHTLLNDLRTECRNLETLDQDQDNENSGNILECTENDTVAKQDDDSGEFLENFNKELPTSLQQNDIKIIDESLHLAMSVHDNQTCSDNECLEDTDFQPNHKEYDAGLGDETVLNEVRKSDAELDHSIGVINTHDMEFTIHNGDFTNKSECGPNVQASNDYVCQEQKTEVTDQDPAEIMSAKMNEPARDSSSIQDGYVMQQCGQIEKESEKYENTGPASNLDYLSEPEQLFNNFAEPPSNSDDERAGSKAKGIEENEGVMFSQLQTDCTLSHTDEGVNSDGEFTRDTPITCHPPLNNVSAECMNSGTLDQDQDNEISCNILECTENDTVAMQDDDSEQSLESFNKETAILGSSENTLCPSLQHQDIKTVDEFLYSVMSSHDQQTCFDNECHDYQDYHPDHETTDAGLGDEIVQNGVGKFGEELEFSAEVINTLDMDLSIDTDDSTNKSEYSPKVQVEASNDYVCQEQNKEVTNQDSDEIVSRELEGSSLGISSVQDGSRLQQYDQTEKEERYENITAAPDLDHMSSVSRDIVPSENLFTPSDLEKAKKEETRVSEFIDAFAQSTDVITARDSGIFEGTSSPEILMLEGGGNPRDISFSKHSHMQEKDVFTDTIPPQYTQKEIKHDASLVDSGIIECQEEWIDTEDPMQKRAMCIHNMYTENTIMHGGFEMNLSQCMGSESKEDLHKYKESTSDTPNYNEQLGAECGQSSSVCDSEDDTLQLGGEVSSRTGENEQTGKKFSAVDRAAVKIQAESLQDTTNNSDPFSTLVHMQNENCEVCREFIDEMSQCRSSIRGSEDFVDLVATRNHQEENRSNQLFKEPTFSPSKEYGYLSENDTIISGHDVHEKEYATTENVPLSVSALSSDEDSFKDFEEGELEETSEITKCGEDPEDEYLECADYNQRENPPIVSMPCLYPDAANFNESPHGSIDNLNNNDEGEGEMIGETNHFELPNEAIGVLDHHVAFQDTGRDANSDTFCSSATGTDGICMVSDELECDMQDTDNVRYQQMDWEVTQSLSSLSQHTEGVDTCHEKNNFHRTNSVPEEKDLVSQSTNSRMTESCTVS